MNAISAPKPFTLLLSISEFPLNMSPFLTRELITVLVFCLAVPINLAISKILAGTEFLALISRTNNYLGKLYKVRHS